MNSPSTILRHLLMLPGFGWMLFSLLFIMGQMRATEKKRHTARDQIKATPGFKFFLVVTFGDVDCDCAANTAPHASGEGAGVLSRPMKNDCACLCLKPNDLSLTGSQLICTALAFQRANDFCHLTLDLVFVFIPESCHKAALLLPWPLSHCSSTH